MAKRKREIERRHLSHATAPVEVRAGMDGQPAELQGYAAVFDQWTTIQDWWGDAWQESVAPGAYAKTIGEADIRALFNHDANVVLGRNKAGTLDLSEDGTGLHDVIRPPDNEWGRPVMDAVRRGDISGQSIAFRVIKEKWERPEKKGDIAKRTILEAQLVDVSVVTYPAFEQTSVQARAELAGMAPDMEEGDLAVVGQSFRLARLAEHGYPLDAEDRATIGAAMEILRRVSGEPAEGRTCELRSPDHSPQAQGDEPGHILDALHSEAARARRLRVHQIATEGWK